MHVELSECGKAITILLETELEDKAVFDGGKVGDWIWQQIRANVPDNLGTGQRLFSAKCPECACESRREQAVPA